jgi:hypothetical protein
MMFIADIKAMASEALDLMRELVTLVRELRDELRARKETV